MPIIEVKNLVKIYKTLEPKKGLVGYFKNLFNPKYKEVEAVKGINFSIEEGELVRIYWREWSGKIYYIKNANRITYTDIWEG